MRYCNNNKFKQNKIKKKMKRIQKINDFCNFSQFFQFKKNYFCYNE